MARWDETHRALSRAARELFAERGFDAVGTAEVARRAGVSEMTLFRHFASKEALVLDDPFDPLMAEAVRRRPDGEGPMRAIVGGIRVAWGDIDAEGLAELRARLRIVAASGALRGAIERSSAATADALVDALVARGVPSLEARVAAGATIAGLSTALLAWAQSDDLELEGAVDRALATLEGA